MAAKNQNEEPEINVVEAIRLLAKERGLEEEELIKAVEEGIVAGFKREFSSAKNIEKVGAEIDRETGEMFVYKTVTVVDDVLDPDNEIFIDEAKAYDPEYEIGDEMEIGLEVEKLGRLAAIAAKSAISQKVRDAECEKIKAEFSDKINEIVSGKIVRRDAKNVYVDIGRVEAVLPRDGQIKNENYDPNDKRNLKNDMKMDFLVTKVEEHNGRPSVILSRTSPNFIVKILEREIAEIKRGEVVIKSIAREAGSRTKVAVYSRDPNIDATGACIGPHGQRIKSAFSFLELEKIDVVNYDENPAFFISEALKPATVIRVDTEIIQNEDGTETKKATAVVPDAKYTVAIGKSGQNVRLAARLTGFKIDIKTESDMASEQTADIESNFMNAGNDADENIEL